MASFRPISYKALVNEGTLLRTHCCGHIVAHDVSWAAQTGKHLLRTQNVSEQNQKHFLCSGRQNVSEQNQKHFLCPQQMYRARANGETFVSATMCPRLPGRIVFQTYEKFYRRFRSKVVLKRHF